MANLLFAGAVPIIVTLSAFVSLCFHTVAPGTKLSLFDEPEAGIDLWSFNNLIRVFESLHEKIKGSIIIISHQERILNIADKIIVLSGGEVTAVGTKDEVMPKLIESSEACSTLLDKLA